MRIRRSFTRITVSLQLSVSHLWIYCNCTPSKLYTLCSFFFHLFVYTKKNACFNFSVGSSRADVCSTVEMPMLNRSCRDSSTTTWSAVTLTTICVMNTKREKSNRNRNRWQNTTEPWFSLANDDECGAKSFLWRCYLLQHNYAKPVIPSLASTSFSTVAEW